ncbi:MAG: hypothetical protein WAN65_06220 [Candidatus Sulfotelmatobacter sp.]
MRLSEKLPTDTRYRRMTPRTVTDELFNAIEEEGFVTSLDTIISDFLYDGPFLTQASAKLQTGATPQGPYSIRISPVPQDTRVTEILFIQQYVEIENALGFNCIPQEAHHSMMNFAAAELTRANNDTLADNYEKQALAQLTEFLTFVRARQIQNYPTQEPYLNDLD